MNRLEKAVANLETRDIFAKIENNTVYVTIGWTDLELSDYEIDYQAGEWDETHTFIIQDWAGNRMFPEHAFETFEDAWEFIYENVDNSTYDETGNENDNVYQDIYVINTAEK